MLDHPVYVRMPTENEEPYFASRSSAEVVISALILAQQRDWLRLHGFILLPEALEMVCTPLKLGVAGMVAHLQAETIPLLAVLLPSAGMLWARRFAHMSLTTQNALNARLTMLLLAPVAAGIVDTAARYQYSSANERYAAMVSVYSGYPKVQSQPADKLTTAEMTPVITELDAAKAAPAQTAAPSAAESPAVAQQTSAAK
jgi:hypothetical protein